MIRKYGSDFRDHGVGTIEALGVRFRFYSPTGAYLRENFRGRAYEPSVCAHLIDRFSNRPICFIDIGAHFGYFSCFAASLHAGNRVHAFEPGPEAFEALRTNFALNRIQGGAHAIALSDEESSVPFHGASMRIGASETTLRVAAERFDSWCARGAEPPDVVKLDVHGSEGKVLFGMQETLRHGRFALYLELHPAELLAGYSLAEIVELLYDSGFEMRELRGFRREHRYEMIPVDAVRRERLVNPEQWTPEERRTRQMFLCEKR